jgi:hypothetical protein
MLATVTDLLQRMCQQLDRDVEWYRSTFESYEPRGPELRPVLQTIRQTLALLGPDLTWNTEVGQLLVHKLLLVLPFPATLLSRITEATAVATAARGLGTMFEAVCIPRRFLKHLSNMWARWSHRWLTALADARLDR